MEATSTPVLLALPAEVLDTNLSALESEVLRLLGPGGTRLVVDLGQTNFLCSGGLGLLVKLSKRLHDRGGGLALARPRPPLARLLRVVGLDPVLPWFPDIPAAAAHASGARKR